MPQNPIRTGDDSGAPFLHGLPVGEGDGGEEVVLAAIDPDGGHQRSSLEVPAAMCTRRHQGQLVNDKVNDVSGDVHRAGCRVQ